MESSDSLESLQTLQRDLVALLDARLENVDRLSMQLEAHIADFKRLLDRDRRNEKSRNLVTQGTNDASTLTIDGLDYSITADFKDAILTVANEVDLDEVEAARLCLAVQEEMDQVDDTLPYRAVLRFHTQRRTVLECLRMVLKRALDTFSDDGDELGDMMQIAVQLIVRGQESGGGQSSAFWRKCINGLVEIEESMSKTQSHIQAILMTGQTVHSVRGEALQVQRMFLAQQHEALASIMCYLIRSHYVLPEDFRAFLSKAAASDLTADLLSHFTPILIAGATRFGSDLATTQSAAEDLHRLFADSPARLKWTSKSFGAAATTFWIVEYSGRVADAEIGLSKSTAERSDLNKVFFKALEDNAFQYMLSVADFYKPEVWHDPAKAGLVRFLLDGTAKFPREAVAPSQDFAQLTMQEIQVFIEALVSHMHGALRELKNEEDSQRRNLGFDEGAGYEMHLERFLLIVAYAYQDDLLAAMDFWGDTESNLYGFLRWTSRRLPTPRVAAFCEMLRSLANGDKAATAAHKFLLEDTQVGVSRGRRAYSLSWQQMFSELELYASSIKNRPAVTQAAAPISEDPDIIETETPIMLEAYLRLIAHVVRNSAQAREWVVREQTFKLHECLLQLAQSATLPPVQACCFEVLAALLVNCAPDIRDGLWFALENWLAAGDDVNARPPARLQRREGDRLYLQRIAADAEVSSAFVNMLNALITSQPGRSNEMPFPESLGSARNKSGIDHYVDFVLSMAFPLSAAEPSPTDDRMQLYVLRHACLAFVQSCLTSFNEDLALTDDANPFTAYSRAHPFARVMEHLFNDQVIAVLFQTAEQNPDELRTLQPTSPLVQAVCMALSTISLIFEKQATYFDMVRPILKTQTSRRVPPVSNPAFASFDDIVLTHLELVSYLAGYMSCPHDEVVFVAIDALKRVSASRKITDQAESSAPRRTIGRLVSRLADSGEALQIELRQNFTPDELNLDSDAGNFTLDRVRAILDLLTTSLRNNNLLPGLAHCLLGFECQPSSVSITEGSLFSQGKALFHSIASMAILIPQDVKGDHPAVLQAVRRGCIEVLAYLASSPLTGSLAISELRSLDFLAAVQASQSIVNESATWEGCPASDAIIWLGDGSSAVGDYLREREYLLNIIADDARFALISRNGGRKSTINTQFVLSLLDFFDIDLALPMEAARKSITDFEPTVESQENPVFDTKRAAQHLSQVKRRLLADATAQEQSHEQQVDDEISAILTSLSSYNKHRSIVVCRLETLEAWVDLLLITVADLGSSTDAVSTLQNMLQVVLPRFDRSLDVEVEAAAQFAKVVLILARTASGIASLDQSPSAMLLQDALLHTYRSCLRAIQDSETDAGLRDICYRTCSLILGTRSRSKQDPSTQHIIQMSQESSDRLIRVVAEDAFASRGVTRISALLFLDAALREFGKAKKTNSLLRTLQKVNFLPVLIDTSISTMATVFRDENVDQSTTLAYFHTSATVLLRVAQAPDGAQMIMNSGFISAVQESGLFSTDPDIGLDIDNAPALREFYRLLAAILRILVAIVIGRGTGDGATMQMVRKFLSDNRMSMAAVFKLLSRQDKTDPTLKGDAQEIADELSRLIHITQFLEADNHSLNTSSRQQLFT